MSKYITPLTSLAIGLLLFFIANWFLKDFNPNEFGLGQNTTSHVTRMHGLVKSGIIGGLDSVFMAIKETRPNSTKVKLAVWIGNSQLHAINKYKKGDYLALQYAQEWLDAHDSNLTLFQFSSPHLNVIEEQIYLNSLRAQDIKPDYLILPITFRSFHFIKIREELKKVVGYKNISNNISDAKVSDVFSVEESNDKRGKLLSKKETWQDKSENYLE